MRIVLFMLVVTALVGCAGTSKKTVDGVTQPAFALEDLPGGLEDLLNRAQTLSNNEEFDQADTVLDNAKTQYAEYPHIELNRALIDIKQEEFDDALAHIEAALEIRPNYPPALNLKGYVSRIEGDFEEAKQAYQQAISVEPDYTKPYLNLGILADLYLQDYILALTSFEQYLDRVKTDEQVSAWIVELKRRIPGGDSE